MEETTLMVLAGISPSIELLSWRMEEADYSIAVDGGFHSFRQADLLPNLLIGDLDSLSETELKSIKYANFQVLQISDQNTTDFEKALNWVSQNLKTKHLIVLGGLGKRSDHMITNLLLASVADKSLEITFDDDREWIRRVTETCPLTLHGRKNANLSILPFKKCEGVRTKGLEWNLMGETIGGNKIVGQSNVCRSDTVEIACDSGSLFVFVEKGA